ncbi:MAG TPA: glycine zipper 2TM domain-containing protein [Rudaea sp.]|nr:glycine zipper 2TM domain-containing protein [Rudaea sp.]
MKIIGILMAGMLLAAQAFAQDRPAPAATPNAQDVAHYGWADVLRVDPVFEEIAQAGDAAPAAQSHEECYEEQVLEEPAGQSDSGKRTGATVIGAIIGGIIGNRFGKGDGRKATTAAGVLAGGAIGNSVGASQDARAATPAKYTTQRRCRQVDGAASAQRKVVAYDVEYRYRGEVYSARLNYDPGDRMRVRVSVTPAE